MDKSDSLKVVILILRMVLRVVLRFVPIRDGKLYQMTIGESMKLWLLAMHLAMMMVCTM